MKTRVKPKYQAGAAVAYVSRKHAIKKLQLSLKDFRRLCIIKGIYPHEPAHKKQANKGSTANRVFYYRKDINFLAHEPIINKFREYKVFLRKLNHLKAKKDESKLKKLYENKPEYNLDIIVKERYPTFGSALRDLDDALSLCFTFAMLPHTKVLKEGMITSCRQLTAEFMHYIIESHSLKNTFISIKGIYYQAEICGEKITWIVPHERGLPHVTDVDFTVLVTFVEFYIAMLGFVNFKLYQMLGLHYPPQIQTGQNTVETEASSSNEDDLEKVYSLAKPLAKRVEHEQEDEEEPIDLGGDEGTALAEKMREAKAINYEFRDSKGSYTGVPVVTSNMDTVGTFEMAQALHSHGLFTTIHKHYTVQEWQEFAASVEDSIIDNLVVSSGISSNDFEKLSQVIESIPALKFICLDVANGYSEFCVHFIRKVAKAGDVAKEFGAGADFAMIGGLFTGHDQSGGDLIENNGKKFKLFYGMSSDTAMKKHHGSVAEYRASEGKTITIPFRGDVNGTVLDDLGGIRSACTYTGAIHLKTMYKSSDHIGQRQPRTTLSAELGQQAANLFKGCVFFLNRETPKEALTFIIRNCGGTVGWENGPTNIDEKSKTITHHIVDRPMDKFDVNRRYAQPQWVFDCLNARRRLPIEKYLPGTSLPPHFSPFASEKPGDYVPVERLDELRGLGHDVTELEHTIPKTDDELPKRKKAAKPEQKKGVHVTLGEMHKKSKEKFHELVEKGNELKMREMMIPKKHQRVYHSMKTTFKRNRHEALKLKKKAKIAKVTAE